LSIAVYPGSFDPITCGHVDIAERAAAVFDKVILAVYDAPSKNLLFSTAERVGMAQQALAGVPNLEVCSYSGLTVEYCRQVGARVIVRGLRAVSDFEIELQMAMLNRKMAPETEVVCLMTSIQHSFLSSSVVKEIARLGGCIDGLVPKHVATALRDKYNSSKEGPGIPRYLSS
jgi:pantetheine-phosphate adenylyltransferase